MTDRGTEAAGALQGVLILGKPGASTTSFTVSPGRTEELTVQLDE